jgi:hypothetical protein
MRIPTICGTIDRRILVNYRVDPAVVAQLLPAPFRPQLVHGHAVAGICLIRLRDIRPRGLPRWMGITSENAAHRFAVEWDDDGRVQTGVFVPRRDSSSRLNALAGGRVFPGVHHLARFDIEESCDRFRIAVSGADGVRVEVEGSLAQALPVDSLFASLDEVSNFFERGSLGYSATAKPGEFDGLELRTFNWSVQPLAVDRVVSSMFDEATRFPPGTIAFDNALLMQNVQHEWHGRNRLCAA